MQELRMWNFEQLKTIIKNYGEVRFKQAPNNDGSFISLPGNGETEFSLKIDENMHFRIILPAKKSIYIDNDFYEADDAKGYIIPTYPCFIADSERQFVMGLDTEKMEIWELITPEAKKYEGAEISVKNLTRIYKNGNDSAGIKNLNFTINPCEFVGIYGGSGSGKSVMIESILEPDFHQAKFIKKLYLRLKNWLPHKKVEKKGVVKINGAPSYQATENIAYLPQTIAFPKNLKCREILKLAMIDRGQEVDWNKIEEKIELCSLDKSVLLRKYGKLSGGQQRRLALAAALLKDKISILIADEPTSGLDIKSELDVMTSLKKISRHGVTVMVVTHSIQSCRMFDKVLVLNKKNDGSRLVFKKQWRKENFSTHIQEKYFSDDIERMRADDTSDAELMAWMMNYENFPADNTPEESSPLLPVLTNNKNKRGKIFWQRITAFLYWTKASHKLIRRDTKGLITFAILAVCCLLAISLGANAIHNIEPRIIFITLTTIAAAWLCATYSAIFTSDLLKYFAYENFAGLKSVSFIPGVCAGQFLIILLISTIFSTGILFFPNTGNILKKFLCTMYPKNVEKTELCEKCLSAYPELCQDHNEYLFYSQNVTIFKNIGNDKLMSLNDFYKDSNQHCAVESGISYLWKRIGDGSAYKRFSKKYTLSLKNYILVYAGMFLTCTVGCMLGIFAAGLFRDAKNATLFLVVLFVVFLLFSRLLLFDPEIQNYLGPIHDSKNAIKDILTLDIKKWSMIIPIFASFTSMSRYITNLICCIPFLSTKEYLFEFGILFVIFGIIPLILAMFCISSRRKNWRILSR